MIKVENLNEEPEKRRARARENSSGQVELNLMDETRVVGILRNARCPVCGWVPNLWRIIQPGTGKAFFQVRCSREKPRCEQPAIPTMPVSDSRDAVRVWRMYLKLCQ